MDGPATRRGGKLKKMGGLSSFTSEKVDVEAVIDTSGGTLSTRRPKLDQGNSTSTTSDVENVVKTFVRSKVLLSWILIVPTRDESPCTRSALSLQARGKNWAATSCSAGTPVLCCVVLQPNCRTEGWVATPLWREWSWLEGTMSHFYDSAGVVLGSLERIDEE
jgi:hypothetical protein